MLPPVASMGSTMMSVLPLADGLAMYSVCMPTSVCSRLVYMRKAETKAFSAWSNTRRKPSWKGSPARSTVASKRSSLMWGMSMVPKGVVTVLGLYCSVFDSS